MIRGKDPVVGFRDGLPGLMPGLDGRSSAARMDTAPSPVEHIDVRIWNRARALDACPRRMRAASFLLHNGLASLVKYSKCL